MSAQITDYVPDIVQLLLEAGASVNQANQSGWAPLHQATRLGHHRMARLLLDWGAELGSGTSRHNTTQVSREYYSVLCYTAICMAGVRQPARRVHPQQVLQRGHQVHEQQEEGGQECARQVYWEILIVG